MKKVLLSSSLLCFALSSSCIVAYAKSTSVIPKVSPGFGFSIAALFLQPGATNLVYAVHTEPVPVPAPSWSQKLVEPGFQPAFELTLQNTFADGVDQIKLEWLDFHSSDSASGTASGTSSIAPPYYFGPGAQALNGTSADSVAKFDVDNVNVVFDRLISFGDHIQLEPFVGLDAAYLKQKITSSYQGTDANTANLYSITSYNTSKYLAMGPRLGLNATGFIGKHFAIIAKIGASLLAGSMSSDTSFLSFGGVLNATGVNTALADQSQTKIVPEVDSDLGMSYRFDFHSGSSLTLQAGYRFEVYVDGINQVVPTALVPNAFNNGVIAIETSGQVQSNFDLSGPYLKLTWLM